MKIIDLSVPHEECPSEPFPPKIEHLDHYIGAQRMAKLAGISPDDFPDSMAISTDIISGSVHVGTHVDAPWHYGPLCEGKRAKTIDEVPLEWCYGPGVVLDMRHKEPGSEITVADLKAAVKNINYTISKKDIVIIWTGADKYWGTPEYLSMQSGLGAKGTAWLLEHGIHCIGIDAWTLDRPAKQMGLDFKRTGERNELWASHIYGRKKEYLQIEKLANLNLLPKPSGFIVSAFPVKFAGCSAGWTRAVAILD